MCYEYFYLFQLNIFNQYKSIGKFLFLNYLIFLNDHQYMCVQKILFQFFSLIIKNLYILIIIQNIPNNIFIHHFDIHIMFFFMFLLFI